MSKSLCKAHQTIIFHCLLDCNNPGKISELYSEEDCQFFEENGPYCRWQDITDYTCTNEKARKEALKTLYKDAK